MCNEKKNWERQGKKEKNLMERRGKIVIINQINV